MALLRGTRLGPYEIQSAIGAGGMGEVYRAKDLKLGREVAIKALPSAFTNDPERVARFEREARTLASLNHPNIAQIHGLEESDGIKALVMELVEGPTLADRIAQGPIALDEALRVAKQIAEALEAAHEQGIIHRDLKPANIKLRPDGTVKVLDFGLAKAFTPDRHSSSSLPLTNSPTLTSPGGMTGVGVILGTAAYMAPEQAKGKVVTKAADIWAFGCVVYEMLTGRAAFQGDDTTEIVAAVVRGEPDWSLLTPTTPTAIRTLLRRCLQKDPRHRWQDATDVRIQIEEAMSAPPDVAVGLSGEHRRTTLRWVFLLGAAAVIAAALGALTVWSVSPGERPAAVTRVLVGVTPANELPRRSPRPAFALSPDGRSVVYVGLRDGQRQLYLRAMDRLEATPLPGTEGGVSPFFSPDGQWLGFWRPTGSGTSGELKKIPVRGGPAVTICQTALVWGVSWGSHGRIVFANQNAGGLWHVPDGGGTPERLTTLDAKRGEVGHLLPHVLPDGKAVLFTVRRAPRWDNAQIVVRSLVTGDQKILMEEGADARYVSTGHLVYARMGTLMAVPFDLERLQVTGSPVGVLEGVMHDVTIGNVNANSGTAQFGVSDIGTLAYLPGGVAADLERITVWVDRTGKVDPLGVPPRPDLVSFRLSPDGRQLAQFTLQVPNHVWITDMVRGTSSPLTTLGQNGMPTWVPGGQRLVFSSSTSGAPNLFWMRADGSSPPERLTTNHRTQFASSWLPDGKTLAFTQNVDSTNTDIWLLSLDNGTVTVRPFLTTTSSETHPEFSPDGRWLAYASDESGRREVYVRPYPGPGPKHPVSGNGGTQPAWARNRRELFYTEQQSGGTVKMMAVDVTLAPSFTAGKPRSLFEGRYPTATPIRGYDVTADGGRFLMNQQGERLPESPSTHIIFVQNWTEELKRLVPKN